MPRAYPANFIVQAGAVRAKPAYYYSGQPLDITVTAMSGATPPAVTTRYEYNAVNKNSNDVQISVVDTVTPARGAVNTAPAGSPQPGLILKASFKQGVGAIYTADSDPAAVVSTPSFIYTYNNIPTKPAPLLTLHATETVATNTVASNSTVTGSEDTIEVRSGRIRIGGAFGSAKGNLNLPVTAEYYDGLAWRTSIAETFNIPGTAIGLGVASGTLTTPTNISETATACPAGVAAKTVCIKNGSGTLVLRPSTGIGTAVAAINLGAAGAAVDDCVATPALATTSTLGTPWLRAPNGVCTGGHAGDPVARATFGVFSPETRRIIHVREVFN
jgi:MSHA biogenesis protein MshQ